MSNEGLRERKKRVTRDTIAATARRLFAERGFDSVTVAEIAAAADVSEKTVFNHFATKEDLVFAGGEARLSEFLDEIRQRPAGTSLLAVFRAATDGMIDLIASSADDDTVFVVPRIVRSSRVLQERLVVAWEQEAAALTDAIAASTATSDDDVMPAVVARTLLWTHRTIFRAAYAAMLEGEDRDELGRRLRAQSARAYDQIAAGIGGYGA
jgi:AcrR family transcriptional regulator